MRRYAVVGCKCHHMGRGRGRPKAASVLSARWRLGVVTTGTFVDISLQRLRCTLFIIICFLSMLVSRPTARCCKSQFLIICYRQSACDDSQCSKILPICRSSITDTNDRSFYNYNVKCAAYARSLNNTLVMSTTGEQTPSTMHVCECPMRKDTSQLYTKSGRSKSFNLCNNNVRLSYVTLCVHL